MLAYFVDGARRRKMLGKIINCSHTCVFDGGIVELKNGDPLLFTSGSTTRVFLSDPLGGRDLASRLEMLLATGWRKASGWRPPPPRWTTDKTLPPRRGRRGEGGPGA